MLFPSSSFVPVPPDRIYFIRGSAFSLMHTARVLIIYQSRLCFVLLVESGEGFRVYRPPSSLYTPVRRWGSGYWTLLNFRVARLLCGSRGLELIMARGLRTCHRSKAVAEPPRKRVTRGRRFSLHVKIYPRSSASYRQFALSCDCSCYIHGISLLTIVNR